MRWEPSGLLVNHILIFCGMPLQLCPISTREWNSGGLVFIIFSYKNGKGVEHQLIRVALAKVPSNSIP